jgi:hypothetical protein
MAHRLRWFPLLVVMLCWSILIWVLGTLLAGVLLMEWTSGGEGFDPFATLLTKWMHDPQYWLNMGILVMALVGSQVIFLLPLLLLRLRPGRPRSLGWSIMLASLVAAMLTVGLAMSLMSLVQLLGGWVNDWGVHLYFGLFAIGTDPDQLDELAFDQDLAFMLASACLFVSWVLWWILISIFMRRGQPLDRLRRLVGLLFAGTLIELVLILPLEAMVRRRTNCFCETGSFQALLGGFVAALWLLGPMAFLILIRRRPAWWNRHCQRCGYEKDRNAGNRCPECGWGWTSANTAD